MATFKTYNPVSGAFLREHTYATATEVSKSLENLHFGFRYWKSLSFSERQKALLPTIDLFKQAKDEFAKIITDEMGKPYAQSLAEVDKSIQSLEYLCTASCPELEVKTVKTFSDPENVSHQIFHRPKGVILGVMPWNFPLWQAVRMIYPAMLAGNTVLLKHSENTPSMGDLIKKILTQIEVKNIFDHLIFEHSLTESVIADPQVQGVSLTGSVKAGYLLSEYAGKYMKRAVFELGGSDAHLVLNDANLAKSAAQIAKSRLQNTGQSCIAAKRVIVDSKISETFIAELKNQFDKYQWGNPFDKKTSLGPLAAIRFIPEDQKRFDEVKPFCDVVYERFPEADLVKSLAVDSDHQAFAPLRILKVRTLTEDFLKYLKTAEFFSPTLLVFEFQSLEEGLKIVNHTDFGLGGSVYSENIQLAQEIALQFESGVVAINDGVASNAMLPFGGIKASGIGRELGSYGFTEFTDTQVVSTTRFV